MPQFFFDIQDGHGPTRDDVGLQMPDGDVARHEAVTALLGIARDSVGRDRSSVAVAVRDEGGAVVLTASLSLIIVSGPATKGRT